MSTSLAIPHVIQRSSQRGVSRSDLELALYLGREVEGGVLVLEKDAAEFAASLLRLAERVRRLAGMRVVSNQDIVVTVYRSRPSKQRRLLRRAERRNLEG
jgi:hypothetical protein